MMYTRMNSFEQDTQK